MRLHKSLSVWFSIICILIGLVVLLFEKTLRDDNREELENKQYSIGLVLSGGGAKGAYQVGVWRALEDLGICDQIGVFSGTSIGAINSALFATGETAANCEITWRELISSVFSLDESLSGESLVSLIENGMNALLEEFPNRMETLVQGCAGKAGVCDAGRLKRILRTNLPRRWKRGAPYVYVTAQQMDTKRVDRFCLNGLGGVDYVDRIMASAACPVLFRPVIIDGVAYVDGGIETMGGDNTPIVPVFSHKNIRKVIVIYLQSRSECRLMSDITPPPGIEIIRIYPSRDISGPMGMLGAIDTSNETITRLIDMGYSDAMAVLTRGSYSELIDKGKMLKK